MMETTGWPLREGAPFATGAAAPGWRDFTGRRALVVEDNELSREILTEFLKDFGFSVTGACDGSEGVEVFAESEPFTFDVILMDMQMPLMEGDDATRAIRDMNRPDAMDVPIIAQTADARHDGSRRARESGMSGLITKPINLQELMAILSGVIPLE